MNPGLAVKLRPAGPWRIGTDSGARNRVDLTYHSDTLYSAVALAMARMGSLDDWLSGTARVDAPAVCFSSCFPFAEDLDFVVPPRTVWPPASASLTSARVRWKSARFVPLTVVQALLAGQRVDDSKWSIDGPSECLVPSGKQGPFRMSMRAGAAVDRLTGSSERHATACIEFRGGCGLWTIVSFADERARDRWSDPVKAAFRWLADSGFGGERSRGWGRSEAPEFREGILPQMILGARGSAPERPHDAPAANESPEADSLEGAAEAVPEPAVEPAALPSAASPVPPADPGTLPQWLLSLFTPAAGETVDWTRGNYKLMERSGRVESPAGSGGLKKQLQMVAEGSVLYAPSPLRGSAPDVAPEGFAHPVYRAGFALSVPLPEAI